MALQDPATQTAQESVESGLRMDRVWFARESQAGQVPVDPNWNLYSDRVIEFSASLNPALERLEGLGTPDAAGYGRALEENEVSVVYPLQQPLVDASGEPVDASYDAFARNQARQIPNTHTIVARDDTPSPGPDDPADASGQRRYIVVKGGKCDASMEPDTTEAEPIPVELTYLARKVRSYLIYQPASSTDLVVSSSSANDTTQDITIESEGAAASETVTLNGTNLVHVATTFDNIDAVWLSSDTEGDVTVAINDGDATTPVEGSALMEINGGNSYAVGNNVAEGDQGVPALGAGSAPSAIGTAYEDLEGQALDFGWDADVPEPALNNITLEVDNGLEPRPRGQGSMPAVEEANRSITIETDVIGERASHDMIRSAYLNKEHLIAWDLGKTRFEFPDSRNTEPPEPARAPDEAFAEIAGTWTAGTVDIINIQ